MTIPGPLLTGILLLVPSWAALPQAEPVASWSFDEGEGTRLRDTAGANHGQIHGATWVESGDGYTLHFDGIDDYVDCGDGPGLDLRKAYTLMAWVRPDRPAGGEPGVIGKFFESYAITYYNGSFWMYASSGGNNCQVPARIGDWSHLAAVFDGSDLRFYLNGEEKGSKPTTIAHLNPGRRFFIGCVIGDPSNIDVALRNTRFFPGLIDGVKVFDKPLKAQEIIHEYNRSASSKGNAPIDLEKLSRIGLRCYPYPDSHEVVTELDYAALRPLPAGAVLEVALKSGANEKVLRKNRIEEVPLDGATETVFDMKTIPLGTCRITAAILVPGDERRFESSTEIVWPPPVPAVPAPADHRVPKLPADIEPPAYQLQVTPDGGIRVAFNGRTFPIESSFSYPRGGDNLLADAPDADRRREAAWKVKVDRKDKGRYEVRAEGDHYTLVRNITAGPTRIEVEDTLTNTGSDVVGIMFSHYVDLEKVRGAMAEIQPNPTVFVKLGNVGLGLLPIDDLLNVQQHNGVFEGKAAIRNHDFGLAPGKSYTFHWAIYPVGSNNYFDFINQIRHDEDLKGYVEGSVELSSRWGPPPEENVANKAIRYVTVCYLTHALQNPHNSLEGWEFMEYPEIADRVRKAIAETRAKYPGLHIMFHVAHSLYVCNHPKEKFPDSVVIDANGNPVHYGPNTIDYYGRYMAHELFEDGWRWWLFYPTLDNSFGELMLQAADYMIHNLGADAIWADGYISGYVKDGYTYDHWDGYSVTIDPETRLVSRKKANITYAALPVLRAVARKFRDAGGVLITNGKPGPLSFQREKIITCNETGGGDQQPIAGLYLGRTVTPLGNQVLIKSLRDIYPDILAKLKLGALYFWYGEQDFVTDKTIVSYMYPITFESIHPGTVRGAERIVTMNSGVYGWKGDPSLHALYCFDGRGQRVPNRFVTTVDQDSVRTELTLSERESAVLARIPLTLEAPEPVNLVTRRYDEHGIELQFNGQADARLVVADGEFKVNDGERFPVWIQGTARTITAQGNLVALDVRLDGPSRVRILRH